jgi:hypothetical protein
MMGSNQFAETVGIRIVTAGCIAIVSSSPNKDAKAGRYRFTEPTSPVRSKAPSRQEENDTKHRA